MIFAIQTALAPNGKAFQSVAMHGQRQTFSVVEQAIGRESEKITVADIS